MGLVEVWETAPQIFYSICVKKTTNIELEKTETTVR